jgi:hypothetical protein
MGNSTAPNPATPDIQCYQGTPVWNGSQWVCPTDTQGSFPLPDGTIVKPVDTTAKPQAPAVITNNTSIPTSLTGLVDWVKGHPYILIGGAALLVWLLFFRGGSSRRSRFSTE